MQLSLHQLRIAAAQRPEEERLRRPVVDRIVVPEKQLVIGEGADGEVELVALDPRRDDLRPGPVEDDLRVEGRRERAAVRRLLRPGIAHRADDERLAAGEEVGDLRLRRGGHRVGVDVVPEQLEGTHAGAAELLALRLERLELALVAGADREPGCDRIGELDAVAPGVGGELGDPRHVAVGVRRAPEPPVVRVVLRRVDPRVQSVRAAEADQVEPLVVRPRRPVEPLDHAGDLHRSLHGRPCASTIAASSPSRGIE